VPVQEWSLQYAPSLGLGLGSQPVKLPVTARLQLETASNRAKVHCDYMTSFGNTVGHTHATPMPHLHPLYMGHNPGCSSKHNAY